MSLAVIELTAPDISCAKCKANIERDLSGQPGIEQVSVDVAARRVRITYNPDHTGPGQLQATLAEIGYPAIP